MGIVFWIHRESPSRSRRTLDGFTQLGSEERCNTMRERMRSISSNGLYTWPLWISRLDHKCNGCTCWTCWSITHRDNALPNNHMQKRMLRNRITIADQAPVGLGPGLPAVVSVSLFNRIFCDVFPLSQYCGESAILHL